MGSGHIKELRDEGEKERRRLRIGRLDQNAFAECLHRSGTFRRLDRQITGIAKGADAEPDQIGRAGELQGCEGLRAGEDDGGDAEAACDRVNEAAEPGTERGCDADLATVGQRSGRHIKDAGAGNDRDNKRRDQEQREVGWKVKR
jgi:hypothetical protein